MHKKNTVVNKPFIAFSLLAVALGLIHQFCFKWDPITLALFAAAVVPWVATSLKSIEIAGLGKVEFSKAAEEVKEGLAQANLLQPPAETETQPEADAQQLAPDEPPILASLQIEDPKLALAELNIELNQRLQSLADASGLIGDRRNTRTALESLYRNDLLSSAEFHALLDLANLLEDVLNGRAVAMESATRWAKEVGTRLLETLDRNIVGRRLENQVREVMRSFHGQTLPGHLFNRTEDVVLPNFTSVNVEAKFGRKIVDVLGAAQDTVWVVETKMSSRSLNESFLRFLQSYQAESGAVVWLIIFGDRVRPELRELAREADLLLSTLSDWLEIKRLVSAAH